MQQVVKVNGAFSITFVGQRKIENTGSYRVELGFETHELETRVMRLIILRKFTPVDMVHLGDGVFRILFDNPVEIMEEQLYLTTLAGEMYPMIGDYVNTTISKDWDFLEHLHD